MITKKITYTDFNGEIRTEPFAFHITETELLEMECDTDGGWTNMVKSIAETNDIRSMKNVFKNLVLKSFGVKSVDGKTFRKTDEITQDFLYSAAFDALFMELFANADEAAKFFVGVLPKQYQTEIEKRGGVDKLIEENLGIAALTTHAQ